MPLIVALSQKENPAGAGQVSFRIFKLFFIAFGNKEAYALLKKKDKQAKQKAQNFINNIQNHNVWKKNT